MMTAHRRPVGELVLAAALLAGCAGTPPGETGHGQEATMEPTEYGVAAARAGRWLREVRRTRDDGGVDWPIDPAQPDTFSPFLYEGTAGVALFHVEHYRHGGGADALAEARLAGDRLLQALPADDTVAGEAGLWVGWSGVGFALEQVHAVTGDPRYRDGALRALRQVHRRAVDDGERAHWGATTDIVYGNAGLGLYLLWATRRLDDPASLSLAERAGRWLLGDAIAVGAPGEAPRLKWSMREDVDRLMPNFSHGTAGVAYFLAELHAALGRDTSPYLEAAIAGARYLLSIAETEGGRCLVFHHEGDGEELQYLGWCHGPVGTARLFQRLAEVTGDDEWSGWTARGARGVRDSGIPEERPEGFWNNVGQCCGSAGVIEFFLSLWRVTGDEGYLQFARRMADDVLARASATDPDADTGGLRWIQAEHRTRPDLLQAQTGYMQGAAGIGIALLHVDAAIRGLDVEPLVLPDSPFPGTS